MCNAVYAVAISTDHTAAVNINSIAAVETDGTAVDYTASAAAAAAAAAAAQKSTHFPSTHDTPKKCHALQH